MVWEGFVLLLLCSWKSELLKHGMADMCIVLLNINVPVYCYFFSSLKV